MLARYASLWVVALLGLLKVDLANALTNLTDVQHLCYLREVSIARERAENRGHWWEWALESWHCDGDLSKQDVCGPVGAFLGTWGITGQWDHVYCRDSEPYSKNGANEHGRVTNIHITDDRITGPVPKELCLFDYLKELDLDGGQLVGGVPGWIPECFPRLAELDLTYNQHYAPLPTNLSFIPFLEEIKLSYNHFYGPLPNDFCHCKSARAFELENNDLTGPILQCFNDNPQLLTTFLIGGNDFEGDLSGLVGTHLVQTSTHSNPKLCGRIPSGVRWANGFNSYNTSLGQPCADELLELLEENF